MARNNHHSSKPPRRKKYQGGRKHMSGGLSVIAARMGESPAELTLRHADHSIRPQEIRTVNTQYWMALDEVKRGNGNQKAMAYLITAMNMACVLTELGLGTEYQPTVISALEGLHRSMVRAEENGVYRLDGDAVRTIQEMLEVHDAQMEHATHREIEAAKRMIDERIAQGQTYTHQPEMTKK